MNLLLIEYEEISSNNHVFLNDRRSNHILKTLRSKIGDFISAGIINGPMGKAEILKTNIEENCIEIKFYEDTTIKNPNPINLTVIVALPRPKVASRIIRNCSEFGVKDIHFIHSYKVEKSYWQSPLLKEKNTRTQMLYGLEQSKDTSLPSLTFHRKFKPFVEDELENIVLHNNLFVAHPYKSNESNNKFSTKNISKDCKNIIIIGPEGGFIDYEIDLMKKNNCKIINLGSRIFRTETALSTIIALFSFN